MALERSRLRKAESQSPEIKFGRVLRAARQKAGFSQDSLASATGYHRNYIGQLERGEKNPSLRTIFDLAQALKTKASRLVRETEETRVTKS
jgi:transcriptional regulator with XRE-family HTH domain